MHVRLVDAKTFTGLHPKRRNAYAEGHLLILCAFLHLGKCFGEQSGCSSSYICLTINGIFEPIAPTIVSIAKRGGAMPFQRIFKGRFAGATLMNLCLDSLHTEQIDIEGLKQWVDKFANLIEAEFELKDETGSHKESFYELFMFDLVCFCTGIAQFNSEISNEAYKAILDLTDSRFAADKDDIDDLRRVVLPGEWSWYHPMTFRMLVRALGKGSGMDVNTAAEVAYFYRQVARYIYSIDHAQSLDENEELSEYISSFFKYVEVASARDFDILPDNKIIDVLQDWEELVNEEKERREKSLCGVWLPTRGNAIVKGGLRELVIHPDGTGSLKRRKHFQTSREPITWEIQDYMGAPMPVVHIPSLEASINFIQAGDQSLIGTVFSSNSKLNQTMVTYERD